jgi:hypothetical protein
LSHLSFSTFRFQILHLSLPFFAFLLLACQACLAQPRSVAGDSRNSPAARARQAAAASKPAAVPFRRPQDRYPDPRYRAPVDLAELRSVAAKVARSSGRVIHWQLALGEDPGPLAKISGGIDDCRISIHPVASRRVPPNTWAFIFGHEFAHRVESLGSHGRTSPANELKADIAGARYAMTAGYRLESFLGWMIAQPDQKTASHGSLHQRVHAIAAHFRIPKNVIQAEAERHSKLGKKN